VRKSGATRSPERSLMYAISCLNEKPRSVQAGLGDISPEVTFFIVLPRCTSAFSCRFQSDATGSFIYRYTSIFGFTLRLDLPEGIMVANYTTIFVVLLGPSGSEYPRTCSRRWFPPVRFRCTRKAECAQRRTMRQETQTVFSPGANSNPDCPSDSS
jgi:hypothetical protein